MLPRTWVPFVGRSSVPWAGPGGAFHRLWTSYSGVIPTIARTTATVGAGPLTWGAVPEGWRATGTAAQRRICERPADLASWVLVWASRIARSWSAAEAAWSTPPENVTGRSPARSRLPAPASRASRRS